MIAVNFLGVGNIISQKRSHIFRIGSLKRRYQDGAEKSFDIEMTRHAENSNWVFARGRSDFRNVTRGAVDSNRGHAGEMLHVFAREPDWPAEFLVWNHSE